MLKVCNEFFIHLFTHVTLKYFNFKWQNELQDAKGSLSTYFCFYIMLCCRALIFTHYAMLNIMLMRKLVPHFAPS